MAAYKFVYRVPGIFKAPAEVAGAVCDELSENGGLTPERLVEASADINAPLHDEFEWNDSVAAHKFRITQAQTLIRNIRIVPVDSEDDKKDGNVIRYRQRGFECERDGSHVYKKIAAIANDKDFHDRLLECAQRDIAVFIAKYKALGEIEWLIDQMQLALD